MYLFFVKNEDLVKKDVLPMPEPYIENDSIKFNLSFLNTPDSKLRQRFAFVRAYSVGNLLKEVFEVYHNGLLLNILLDKFALITKSSVKYTGEKYTIQSDHFYLMNKKILEALTDKTNTIYHPIIVQIDDYPIYYDDLITALDLNVYPLMEELAKYHRKDLIYWKASGKTGHWNQIAHRVVGEYLIREIFYSILNDKILKK